MARNTLTATTLTRNDGTNVAAAYTAIAGLVALGAKILYPEQDQLILHVKNTEGTTNTVTIKASTAPFAVMAGQGDLVVTVAATTGDQMIAGLEQMRFKNADGYIYLDFETGMTGWIAGFIVP